MSDYKKVFAENLRILRRARTLTQEKLANLLGFSKKTVSKWECAAAIPDIETLFNLAKLLRVNIEDLFRQSQVYFLGIDGGGTKTELALADAEGNVIRTLICDTCNPMDIGIENAKKVLKEGIWGICEDIPLSSVVLYAGIAGGTTANMHRKDSGSFSLNSVF